MRIFSAGPQPAPEQARDSHSPAAATPGAAAPVVDTAVTSPPRSNIQSAQASLRAFRHRLRFNGVAVSALGNTTAVNVSARAGKPLSTMRDGPARPKYAERTPHEPVLSTGAVNPAGRHARDASEIAAEQWLGTAGKTVWPLPRNAPFKAAPLFPLAEEPELADVMGSKALFQREAARLFGPAMALSAVLENLASDANEHLAGPFERPTLMLQALAATTGGDAKTALAVLTALQGGIHFPDAEGAPADAAMSAQVRELSLLTARLLAQSGGAGFEALLAAAPPPPEVAGAAHPRRVQSLRMHLQAGAELQVAQQLDRAHPAAQLAQTAALKLWQNPEPAHLSPAERAAHFNWRNKLREPGADGDLAKAQNRLHKGLVWMGRAEKRGRRKYNWTVNPARFIGHSKTPVSAVQDGSSGAHLDTDAKENQKFDDAMGQAVGQLGQLFDSKLAAPADSRTLTVLALTGAKLASWQAQINAGKAPEACSFDGVLAERIFHDAATRLESSGQRAAAASLRANQKNIVQSVGAETPTLETLERWVYLAAAGTPAGAGQAGQAKASVQAARQVVDNLAWKPKSMAIDDVTAFLQEYMLKVPMGNRVQWRDGAVTGINNTSLPGLPASPDVRLRRNAPALMEINTAGHAHELFLGKQELWQGHIGAQHTTGFKLFDVLHAGTTEGANIGGEAGYTTGVRLRFLRQLDENLAGTDQHKQLSSGFMSKFGAAAKALQQDPAATAEQTWQSLLVDAHFDDPVSVSWQDHPQQSSKIQLYSVNGLSAQLGGEPVSGDLATAGTQSVGGMSVGASAMVGVELQPSIGLNRSERSGAAARTVVQMGTAARVISRFGVSASVPGKPAANLISASSSHVGAAVIAATRGLMNREDRLDPNFMYQDVESESMNSFLRHLGVNPDQWAAALGAGNLEAQLTETARDFQPNQRPAERWRILEDGARRFDALRSSLILRETALKRSDDPTRRAALDEECNRLVEQARALLLDFAKWWEPVGIWNLEVNNATKSLVGFNTMVQLTPERSVSADRELSYLGSSTAQMNRATTARRPATPATPASPASMATDGSAAPAGTADQAGAADGNRRAERANAFTARLRSMGQRFKNR